MTEVIYKNIRHGYARIDKDGKLLITIPLSKKWKEFETIMIQKWEKLLKHYNTRTHVNPIQKDTILLFGEQVPIKNFFSDFPSLLREGATENSVGVGLNTKKKTWNLLPATTKFLKKILEEYAKPIFDTYSKKLWIPYKKLSIRKTSSKRWSCTHDQKFSLNLDLVHLPTKYIKYVIIHECCHLKIKNHSKKFRALVESFCPTYKETKKELRKFVIR